MIYAFNINYTGDFDLGRMLLDTAVTLGLLGVYSLQKRQREKQLESALQQRARQTRDQLRQTVAERIDALDSALEEVRCANAARNEFFARVTDDFKSPLMVITSYTQRLKREAGDTGKMSRVIDGSAQHMISLIDRMIGYARDVAASQYRPAPVHLVHFLRELEQAVDVQAKRQGNAFRLVFEQRSDATICTDETLLRTVLLNLLENSCKYTRNGRVELIVGFEREGAREWLKASVIDTGCGIDPVYQPQLFEPFFRVRDTQEQPGSGLGLAIVKELVEKMAGRIELWSRPGRGTRVTLLIPLGKTPGGLPAVASVSSCVGDSVESV